jgi:D-3-phosphoglycerate dehydrogenase
MEKIWRRRMRDLKSCCVLVTPTSFGINDPKLLTELEELVGRVIYNPERRPLASQEVARLIKDCEGYIAGLDIIDREVIQASNRLRVIARYGVGIDNIDLDAARDKGIVVTNTPGANSVSVAELTIALMLALVRQLPIAIERTRKGEWPRLSGVTLEGKNVGLIGLGAVGKEVAKRLRGFACNILAYDPFPDKGFSKVYQIQLVTLQTLLDQSDIVSLHMPLSPETKRLVNEDFLARMKPGSYLVNTARGELVDEEALTKAVSQSHLSAIALDVLSLEPPSLTHPLLNLPQVIITPHCASHTDGAMNAMGWMALKDCLAVLKGEEPRNRVV